MSNVYVRKFIDQFGSWITTIGFLKYYKPKKGDVIIDCGAYLGYFTILAAKKVGNTGKVVAFEPDNRNFKILQKKILSKNLTNVILINKALYNKNTTLNFSSNFSDSIVIDDNKNSSITTSEIDAVTLDSELKKIGINKVDFIKMDIEGAELELIEGANEILKNTSRLGIACYHERNGTTTGKILPQIFKEKGFISKVGFSIHETLYVKNLRL
ncbi:MAG: FkbM family methyltransferase [Candidatus Woesearchaeota archaeon]